MESLRTDKSATRTRRASRGAQARVDAALADSFPASDPPPWTLGPPAWAKDMDEPEAIPLHAYCHSRIIVLSASASAQEAALAMQTNGIGAILVAGDTRIVGIVTDRDLALRVVAANRNPRGTRLREIMSKDLVTLAPEGAQSEALAVMRDRQIRRIALIEPAQTRPFDEWRSLAAMVRSLAPTSGKKLIARLPAMLRARLLDLPAGPDASVTRASIEEDVAAALSVQRSKAAAIIDVVGALLARSVAASDAVGRRLPDELRSVLRPRRAAARVGARSVAPSKRARQRA